MEVELEKAKYELHQARTELERLKTENQRAIAAAQEYADKALRCEASQGYPAEPAEVITAVMRADFEFEGDPVVVTVHIVGNGVDESFQSDDKGRIAVELPVGSYQAELLAPGYTQQRIQFDVVPESGVKLGPKLTRATPAG
jgi:hypothetical protein